MILLFTNNALLLIHINHSRIEGVSTTDTDDGTTSLSQKLITDVNNTVGSTLTPVTSEEVLRETKVATKSTQYPNRWKKL